MKPYAETATIMVKDASEFNVVERSIWHFNKLYKTLPIWNPKRPVEINENLSLLTMSSSSSNERTVLSPQTQLNFVYRKYRFVVSIDTSMSLFATNITTGLPVFSDILLKLHTEIKDHLLRILNLKHFYLIVALVLKQYHEVYLHNCPL